MSDISGNEWQFDNQKKIEINLCLNLYCFHIRPGIQEKIEINRCLNLYCFHIRPGIQKKIEINRYLNLYRIVDPRKN